MCLTIACALCTEEEDKVRRLCKNVEDNDFLKDFLNDYNTGNLIFQRQDFETDMEHLYNWLLNFVNKKPKNFNFFRMNQPEKYLTKNIRLIQVDEIPTQFILKMSFEGLKKDSNLQRIVLKIKFIKKARFNEQTNMQNKKIKKNPKKRKNEIKSLLSILHFYENLKELQKSENNSENFKLSFNKQQEENNVFMHFSEIYFCLQITDSFKSYRNYLNNRYIQEDTILSHYDIFLLGLEPMQHSLNVFTNLDNMKDRKSVV